MNIIMQNPTKFRVGFNSKMNRMKKEHNVACLWVDNLEYQSNTVIIAELVLRVARLVWIPIT
jgi:hypothetical protein